MITVIIIQVLNPACWCTIFSGQVSLWNCFAPYMVAVWMIRLHPHSAFKWSRPLSVDFVFDGDEKASTKPVPLWLQLWLSLSDVLGSFSMTNSLKHHVLICKVKATKAFGHTVVSFCPPTSILCIINLWGLKQSIVSVHGFVVSCFNSSNILLFWNVFYPTFCFS